MSAQDAKNRIIGLTGGIATGKSTVSAYLVEQGYPVIDSDKIVHELYADNKRMLKEIISEFELDKDADVITQLRSFVFNDREKLETLNGIVHPYVFDEVQRQIKQYKDEEIIFIDMPLLFEVGYQSECDEVWLAYTPQSIQIKRLMKRDKMNLKDAISRIALQMEIEEKRMLSDRVLDNKGSRKKLYHQIDTYLEEVSDEK